MVDEMGRACSTNGGTGMHIGYWWESQNERDHYEDQDIVGRKILKWILDKMGWYGLDLVQDRDQWRALVNTVMNLRVP
jgi:hypothetical protein